MSDILTEVKAIVGDVMKIDTADITLETRFVEDLKADSMDQFFLIDGVSEKYKLTISDKEAPEIKTVGDVVKFVESKLG
jgi:acyl carrier protein